MPEADTIPRRVERRPARVSRRRFTADVDIPQHRVLQLGETLALTRCRNQAVDRQQKTACQDLTAPPPDCQARSAPALGSPPRHWTGVVRPLDWSLAAAWQRFLPQHFIWLPLERSCDAHEAVDD